MKLLTSIKDLKEDVIYLAYYPATSIFYRNLTFFKKIEKESVSQLSYILQHDFDNHLLIVDYEFNLGMSDKDILKYGGIFELTNNEIMMHFVVNKI